MTVQMSLRSISALLLLCISLVVWRADAVALDQMEGVEVGVELAPDTFTLQSFQAGPGN